jgi:hypothetical protein
MDNNKTLSSPTTTYSPTTTTTYPPTTTTSFPSTSTSTIKIDPNNLINVRLTNAMDQIRPERDYNTIQSSSNSQYYQNIGFIESGSQKYQLYGKKKYSRGDKYEYYYIDNSMNSNIKVPFKTKNDAELFDGDTVTINNQQFTVRLYEYKQFMYADTLL